jgi:hypothetical protein
MDAFHSGVALLDNPIITCLRFPPTACIKQPRVRRTNFPESHPRPIVYVSQGVLVVKLPPIGLRMYEPAIHAGRDSTRPHSVEVHRVR